MLTVDRPGIGRSDPKADRTLAEWPSDVEQLADAVGIARFSVIGHSAGGAYALACARFLPDRVVGSAIVAGVPPLDTAVGVRQLATARYWELARDRPAGMRVRYATLARVVRAAPALGNRILLRHASAVDRAVIDQPPVRDRVARSMAEAVRQGASGLVDDMAVLLRRWDFRPGEISGKVWLWHGEQDASVPADVTRSYAEQIVRSRSCLVPNEGHFSLPERRTKEILGRLVASRETTR